MTQFFEHTLDPSVPMMSSQCLTLGTRKVCLFTSKLAQKVITYPFSGVAE
ncbi:hypothetical protein [Wolbachia endosymbiont of Psylliodes chrysocephala]|nr:hypothetical protein [Wolbachia endosymbiont of Psylliodes chrysocephala]